PNSSFPSFSLPFLLSELSISSRRRRRRSSKTPSHCLSVSHSLALMARVGLTTRPLASSSSTPNSPPPPSSSSSSPPPPPPPTKRRKFNHRRDAGARKEEEQQQQQEFSRLKMSDLGGGGGDDSTTSTAAADLNPPARRSGEIERCSPSPNAAAPDADEKEEEFNRLGSDASCCSSNGSSEGAFEFSDLQEEMESESLMNSSGCRERRETTSSRSTVIVRTTTTGEELKSMERPELRNSTAEGGEEESSAAAVRNSTTDRQRMAVTEAELELFFSSMSGGNQELNRLNEKYNFDFANEKPLEGRYEWIPLKP
ncbi:unnamed protein product, partial [Linum tenue]